MFSIRPKEQAYAFVPDGEHPQHNRYGKSIETVSRNNDLRGKSLKINGDPAVSDNPNRYKQHGFYFNADNCISCHACEAACSEKNDLPVHIAFRSVGYVEGGSYPAYTRMNISMACNHCDDPVCLKGCPTRAYTKFAEYGAVLQDPDICFGCGYCTWVCPYNAPQLDPVAGHVSKCNMCVDRLEVGLKPACAAACLAGALDFGIIETKPDHRDQVETHIPGFPTPEITHPNIRFQQTRSLPRQMYRPDNVPIRYERDAQGAVGSYHARVAKSNRPRQWNLKKLRTREDPLVVFTLISQAVVGAFVTLFVAPLLGIPVLTPATHPVAYTGTLFGLIGVQTLALVLSTMHLGRPHRFYRAFNNLRYSPVSREVAGIAVFYNLIGAFALFSGLPFLFTWLPAGWLVTLTLVAGWTASVAGIAAIYFMHRIYRIPARPFWNHWQVLASFFGSMLVLGPMFIGLIYAVSEAADGDSYLQTLKVLGIPVLAGLMLEATGLYFHARDMCRRGGEGAAAYHEQTTTFGYTSMARNIGLGLAMLLVGFGTTIGADGSSGIVFWGVTLLLVTAVALIGRALFYALVVPTTMPGAFFWKNRAFEAHARETGLAKMPQVGVVADLH